MRRLANCFFALLFLAAPTFAQDVSITLTPLNPPVVIPDTGGTFQYNLVVSNSGDDPLTFDAWVMSRVLPNGEWKGPFLNINRTLAADSTMTITVTQHVTEIPPGGTYLIEGYVGYYPSPIWISASFSIEVLDNGTLWIAYYDGTGSNYDFAESMAIDNQGNTYVTGRSIGVGTGNDYATVKYNLAGVQEWVVRYNGPGNANDAACAIAIDRWSNVYVTGTSFATNTNNDYATIKYDTNGEVLWVARYNGAVNGVDGAVSLVSDGEGNVYVTGYSYSNGINQDIVTIKYDTNGNELWLAVYNGPADFDDCATGISIDTSNNVYITGYSYNAGMLSSDYVTVKYDESGLQQWVARYQNNGLNQATAIAVDNHGNAYVTGFSAAAYTHSNYVTVKYNASGSQLWVRTENNFHYNGDDRAYSIALDQYANVYVTGESWRDETQADYLTIKYNTLGVRQWIARDVNSWIGWGGDQAALSITVDRNCNVYVTGRHYNDCRTIGYNSNGICFWYANYGGATYESDFGKVVASDTSGNVYVTGSYAIGNSTDYFTIKYSPDNLLNWEQPVATVLGIPLPVEYRLEHNFPNPFNPTTTISYQLPTKSQVKLEVYDISGRLVATLIDGWRDVGSQDVIFDASGMPSGVYIARLKAEDYTAVQKNAIVEITTRLLFLHPR